MSAPRLIGRIVHDEREANALPDRTVLVDSRSNVYQLDEVWISDGHAQRLAHEPGTEMSGYTNDIDYPAVVVWTPGERP